LNQAPTDNVTVAITSADGQISASPATVTFTPSNWNVVQTVTISAVEDATIDGDKNTTFTVGVSASNDSNYNAVADASVPVSVIDSGRVPGITISESGGDTQLLEGGASDTLTIVLNTPPSDNVTITITDNDTDDSEISYSPTTLTFTPSNWDQPQTITLSALEDYLLDGNQTIQLNMNSSSADLGNNGLSNQLTLSVSDSGRFPGIVITSSGSTNQVSENGTTTDTITLVLNTPPTDNVTVTITDNDTDDSEVSYLPDNLTFTPSDWNVAQTVTLTAIEDYVQDNHQTTLLTMTSSSGDATNDNLSSTTEVLTVDSQTAGGITISQSSLTLS
jgi:hypothetical protein